MDKQRNARGKFAHHRWSSRPTSPRTPLLHLVGDVIALIEELCEEQAVVVGHDSRIRKLAAA